MNITELAARLNELIDTKCVRPDARVEVSSEDGVDWPVTGVMYRNDPDVVVIFGEDDYHETVSQT